MSRCILLLIVVQAVLTVQQYVLPSDTLPPTPKLPRPNQYGYVNLSTVDIWTAQFGTPLATSLELGKPPVVFLHGAFANSDYFGNQIEYLLETTDVSIISIDSRMQGRSTGVNDSISYALMRDDVIGVLDHFNVPKAVFVGWSDGGIIGLDIAMNYPSRVERLFSFAASYNPNNVQPTINSSPVWQRYVKRTKREYRHLSPTPNLQREQERKINKMLATKPNFDKADFARIPTLAQNCTTAPFIWIVDAANEEALKLNTPRVLHRWILDSGLMILPSVSHFAFLQDPDTFDAAIGRLLDFEIKCLL